MKRVGTTSPIYGFFSPDAADLMDPGPQLLANWNTLDTVLAALRDRIAQLESYGENTVTPFLSAEQTSTGLQTLTTAVIADITFNNEILDTVGMHTPGNATITIQSAGIYYINGQVAFDANATGYRMVRLLVNGSDRRRGYEFGPNGSQPSVVSVEHTQRLVAGDTLVLQGYQSSGANLSTSASSGTIGARSLIQVVRLSK